MNWLHYLVEANLYLSVFYLVYCLFLSDQTWYSLNRAYLLISSILAFFIPFIQLGFLKSVEAPQVVDAVLLPQVHSTAVKVADLLPAAPEFTWQDGLIYLYLTGAAILLIAFLVKIYQLFRLTRADHSNNNGLYKLVSYHGSNTAFSFFNFLFIGTDTQKTDTIIKHELVHITQKHSADIVFIELLKIVNWFNPFVYLLQHSLKVIHEYIADEQTAMMENDAIAYSTFLVDNAYGLGGSSITHSFFNYNLLKKRIIMLNQKRSGKLARLRYLLAIPVCAGLLCTSTLAFSKSYALVELLPNKIDSALKPRYDVWNKSYDNTFITSKGYKVRERIVFINGAVSKTVEIFDNDNQVQHYEARFISAKECKFLKDQYGYQFPVDTVLNVKPSSPSTPDSPAANKLKPARPTVHQPTTLTKTGYRYEQNGYIVNGKTDFRVIIFEKNGDQREYFKSKASAAELKLLRDKYGYSFPAMQIYTKLPPPPPAAPAIAAPVVPSVDNRPPPPPPAPTKTTKLLPAWQSMPDFLPKSEKGC